MIRRSVLLAFAPLLVAGCGLVNIQTNIPGLAGGGSGGPGLLGAPYDEDEVGKAVLETYKSWDYESCNDAECVNAFKKKAGVTEYQDKATYVYQFNPRRTLKNPDPEWLTGWDKLSEDEHANEADKTYQALIVAAMRKTWLKKCHADYLALDKELRAEDAKWEAEVNATERIKSPYGRIGALLGIQEKMGSSQTNEYVDQLHERVGHAQFVRVALKKAFESTGRDYLYALEGRAPSGGNVRNRLEPVVERDMYCVFAAANGTQKTPALPRVAKQSAYTERGATAVKPLFPEELVKKVDDLWEKEALKARDALKPADIKGADITTVASGKGEVTGHSKLGYYGGFGEVKKVSQSGGRTELEIADHYDSEYPYDCVETRKIDRITDDGHIVYRSSCKYGKSIKDTTVKVTIGELPEGITIQVGDKVEGYTTVQKHDAKTITETKPLVKKTESWVLDMEHVSKVIRKNQTVGRWF